MAEKATLSAFQFPLTLTAMKYKLLKSVTVRSIAFVIGMGQQYRNTIKIFLTG